MGNKSSRQQQAFSAEEYERRLGYGRGHGSGAAPPSPVAEGPYEAAERPAPAATLTRAPSYRGFSFADSYTSLPDLQADLRRAGLESSNMVVFVDFTKSNEWTGKASFSGRCLHAVDPTGRVPTPYESTIMILGETLSAFDDDQLIPAYGFGCATTNDHSVFSFQPGDRPCEGFAGVLASYRAIAPRVKLAGPTSFGPAIRKAMAIVQATGQYHIAVIIADGQITRSSDLPPGEMSPQESDTVEALVAASALPLSIIVVGVGDGEDGWRYMKQLDDLVPERQFDNLQFVALNEALTTAQARVGTRVPAHELKAAMEATFALQALMEVPMQYRAISGLRLLGPAAAARVRVPAVRTLEPPSGGGSAMPSPGGAAFGSAYGSGFYAGSSAASTPAGGAAPAGPAFGGAGSGGYAPSASGGYAPTGAAAAAAAPGGPHRGDFGLSSLALSSGGSAAGYSPAGGAGGAGDAPFQIPHVAVGRGSVTGTASGSASGRSSVASPASPASPISPSLHNTAVGTAGSAGGSSSSRGRSSISNAKAGSAGSSAVGTSSSLSDDPSAVTDPAAVAAAADAAAADADAQRLRRELERMETERTCVVCLERPKNMAFQCGHQVCADCGPALTSCPICRTTIATRIKLF